MLNALNAIFPIRYTALVLCLASCITGLWAWWSGQSGYLLAAGLPLSLIGVYDLAQSRSSILRNYPVIGHLRFLLEFIRPEIRQYFIENDTDEAPF